MEILNRQQIMDGLKDRRLYVVARKTGLSYPTLKSLADGTGNPMLKTLEIISAYLKGE